MSKKSDDYVRPPDKTTKMRLVGDDPNDTFENDEDFLRYKFLTMHNTKIPNEVKEAMIASKREQMVQMRRNGHVFSGGSFNPFFGNIEPPENQYFNKKLFGSHANNSWANDTFTVDEDIDDITFQPPVNTQHSTLPTASSARIQTLSRNDAYTILVGLIFEHYDEFNAYCNVEGLVLSIQQYLDEILDEIILQSDICWGIRQNIDLLSDEDTETKTLLKKIFIPDSIDDYERFNEMLTVQKKLVEIDDLEEINKQIQLQHELEEKEKLQKIIEEEEKKIRTDKIEKRNMLMNNLFQQLIRLSIFDGKIKELKELVTEPVEKYIALETDYVIVSSELYNRLILFIKQIRLDSSIKEELVNTFQYN